MMGGNSQDMQHTAVQVPMHLHYKNASPSINHIRYERSMLQGQAGSPTPLSHGSPTPLTVGGLPGMAPLPNGMKPPLIRRKASYQMAGYKDQFAVQRHMQHPKRKVIVQKHQDTYFDHWGSKDGGSKDNTDSEFAYD